MNAASVIDFPTYWDEACQHLMKKDRVMRKLIPKFGDARLVTRGDAFVTLARSIVGQQISVKAAQTVWERFEKLTRRMTPTQVLKLKVDDMRAAGLSARKVEYLVDLSLHFDSGQVSAGQWHAMDDEAIIAELVNIRGIGRWTAEMFLIFHLMRPNVMPLDDLGLLKGISLNYFSGEPVSRGGGGLGALPLGSHMVHLAQPRSVAGRVLTQIRPRRRLGEPLSRLTPASY